MKKMRRARITVTIAVLLLLLWYFPTVRSDPDQMRAAAAATTLQVTPSNYFVQPGSVPRINLTIANVTDLYGWQVQIYFQNTVLNAVNATEGGFLSSSGSIYWAPPTINNTYNSTHGMILIGCTLEGWVSGVNGSGTIATLTFRVVHQANATLHIDAANTWLVDSTRPYHQPIPFTATDGVVSVKAFEDIAVTNVVPQKTVIGQGYTGNVSVTVENPGNADESFNLTTYFDSSPVTRFPVTLTKGESSTIMVCCGTSNLTMGTYNVSAYAEPFPNETDTTNNYLTGGTVTVTIPGDINGDFKVDLVDLAILAYYYGSNTSSIRWNPNADINNSGNVGNADLVILANHYGQHYP